MSFTEAKEYLNKYRSGSSTFEWTLTAPFMIFIVMVIFWVMIMFLSYASYGSLASNIAKDMNMRSIGVSKANAAVGGQTNVLSANDGFGNTYQIKSNQFLVDGVNPGDKTRVSYKNALIYAAQSYKEHFYFPFTHFDNINVSFRQANGAGSGGINDSTVLSNYIVQVDVNYTYGFAQGSDRTFSLMGVPIPGVHLTASGYGIIT